MISIIIRTYNEGRYLESLIEGIRNQDIHEAIEIIVVDSGSLDRTLEIANAQASKVVHIKKTEFTFGRSLNLGCEAARGRYLVFVSGHCIPANDQWLKELVTPLGLPFVGMCYSRQIGNETTKYSEKQVFEKYFPPHQNPERLPHFCNNASSAVIRELWCEYPFDESLTGLEDMHFSKRIIEKGWKVSYCHKSEIYHLHHESWMQIKRRYEREAIALREIMPEIHLNYAEASRFAIAAIAVDLGAALRERQFLKEFPGIIIYRILQYWGSSKGNHRHRKLSRKDRIKYFYPK